MPTPVVIVLAAAFGVAALVLLVCAFAGLGQGVLTRIAEGVAGLVCALNAVGVPSVDHLSLCWLLWLLAPVPALSNVLRVRQARRLEEEQLAATYAAEAQDRQTST